MQGDARIDFANTLRGFAALCVMVSHYFNFWGAGRDNISSITNLPALPLDTHAVPSYVEWFFSAKDILNPAAFGVALFFVISGFVIPFSLGQLNWPGFLVNRLFRIFPTCIVGFSITLTAIFFGTRYFSVDWPFRVSEVLLHYIPGVRDIAWSRHIDFVVWTLEIEIKFYLLCAVLIVLFRRYSARVFLAPIVLSAIAIYMSGYLAQWKTNDISTYILAVTYITASQYVTFMFIGVAFHYLHKDKISPGLAFFCMGTMFAIFCIQAKYGPYPENAGIAWTYGFATLAFAFAYTFPAFFRSNRVFDFFADISYPLYVIHGVAGYVVFRIMADLGIKTWLSFVLVISECLLISWLLHILVERPSQIVGKTLAKRITNFWLPSKIVIG